jgi:hypothetical protein
MNQPDITESRELETDPRGGPRTREEAQQEEKSKKASKIQGEGKLSPWKLPRKKD